VSINGEGPEVQPVENNKRYHHNLPPPCSLRTICKGEVCFCDTEGFAVGYHNGLITSDEPGVVGSNIDKHAAALEAAFEAQSALGFNLLAVTSLPGADLGSLERAWEV
jgi:hypothetical protein